MSPRRSTSWLARLALVGCGLLLGLVAAEGAARLMEPDGAAELLFPSTDNTPEGLYVNSRRHVAVAQPGFTGTTGAGVSVRVNAQGLRGPELADRSEAQRWLVLGDSFVMALQVPESETFMERLSARTGVGFLNAGVDGYSTFQATTRMADLVRPTGAAGVVVVFFLGNDLSDNEHHRQMLHEAARLPDGVPIIQPTPPLAHRMLGGWSRVYGHYSVWARRQAIHAGHDPQSHRWRGELAHFHRSGAKDLQRSLSTTARAITELRDTARRLGVPLMVAVAPPAFAVHTERAAPTLSLVGLDPDGADLQAPDRAILQLLSRSGIASCDLGAPLRAAAESEAVYLTFDGHWNAAGHRVVADALADCLAQREWP